MNIWQNMQKLREHVLETDGCYRWLGQKSSKGYGRIRFAPNHEERANRVSYEVYVGEIPEGMMVCHSCDNPECTNPGHLFLGTARDNMLDRMDKGRYQPVRQSDGKFA